MDQDYISSVSKKISVFSDNMNTKSLLMLLGGVGLFFSGGCCKIRYY